MGDGNRHWRFYIDEYFPYMYGLLTLEHIARRKDKYTMLPRWKKEFMQEIQKYLDKKEIFYLKKDLLEILKLDIRGEYGRVLAYDAQHWPKDVMKDILEIIENIVNKT